MYKAHPDGCQHRLQVLLRLRPYPIRGHGLLYMYAILLCCSKLSFLSGWQFHLQYSTYLIAFSGVLSNSKCIVLYTILNMLGVIPSELRV